LAATAAWLVAGSADAHPLAPMLLEMVERGDGVIDVTWKEPASASRGLDLAPLFPDTCTVASPAHVRREGTGIVYEWQMRCEASVGVGRRIEITGLAGSKANVLVRVRHANGREVRELLTGERSVLVVPAGTPPLGVAWRFLRLGVGHLFGGADHLLFLLGLVLIATRLRRLFWTVTAFTVGHAMTLTLAGLGWVPVGASWIEIAILLSIAWLAAEIVAGSHSEAEGRGDAGLFRRWPWAVAGAFGLIHGLGFASALFDVGLPRSDTLLALLSFNLGIECAQILFVTLVVAGGRGLTRIASHARIGIPSACEHRVIPLPAAAGRLAGYAIGVAAAFGCLGQLWAPA
jgi:hypothetical protein